MGAPEFTLAVGRLHARLLELAEDGVNVTCVTSPNWAWWTSDDAEEREAAAYRCVGCPALAVCGEVARYAPHGIWGGIDTSIANIRQKGAKS